MFVDVDNGRKGDEASSGSALFILRADQHAPSRKCSRETQGRI